MTQRTDRIDELLRQEIGALISREIADPAVGFVTVTDVETAPDLRHAKVWVSVIGPAETRQASVQALQRAMPFIRAQLGRRLRIKRIPEFAVRLDESVERGARVLQLLNELESGAPPDELSEGESLPTPQVGSVREGDPEAADEPVRAGEPAQEPADRVRRGGARRPSGRTRPGGPGQKRGSGPRGTRGR